MRKTFITVFLFFTIVSNAQISPYLKDLSALRSFVQKTASFKAQIKGKKRSAYNEMYNRLALDTSNNPNTYTYFYNLAQLFFPLKDNHLGFYQNPDYTPFQSKESIDSFVNSKEFLDYPTIRINLDSLKEELAQKSLDSVEGIYTYDNYYTIGLFKNEENKYLGVVLDSEVSLWKRGQIAVHLYEFAPNLFKAIYGHPKFKHFIFHPIEKYQNQSLVNSYFYASFSQSIYTKGVTQIDYVNLPKTSTKFALKNIKEDVQYIMIQSFQNNNTIAQSSQRFYDSIKSLLKAPHLVLDLRNNEGGAKKEKKKYAKLLKDYVRYGHLYVLVNNGTLSQAEIFTLELKKLKNVTIIGQQTKGMLAYGSNYGKKEKLPSGKFEVYLTDMNNGSSLLQYEDYGITPNTILRTDKDWVDQVLAIIARKY